jgi:ubiquinone/menaquinone biosynthesis C-methylase UbiE
VSTFSQRGYDRLSFAYHAIEWFVFGNHLQAARVGLLDQLPPWKRMLVLGDGDGRLLQQIVRQLSDEFDQTIVSLDHSESMLNQQRNRLAGERGFRQVEWVQADALSFNPKSGSFDVIVTPFFLDCFTEEELQLALPKWLAGLREDGIWYHVDFVIPAKGWHRTRAVWLSRTMHVFFKCTTGLTNRKLLDFSILLLNIGLQRKQHADRFGGMIVTEIYRR